MLFSAIVPKSSEEVLLQSLKEREWKLLVPWIKEGDFKFIEGRTLEKICIGNGTSSKELTELLSGICELEITDEYRTTLRGRELYWKLHPPRGWRRLVPLGLQVPPEPLDGYAAVVQVRRYLASLSRGE